jgi:hypothetical protein
VLKFSEIQNEISIKKEKLKERKRKAIEVILKSRETVLRCIKKTDAELKKDYEKLNEKRINYDRRGMNFSKIPFKIYTD